MVCAGYQDGTLAEYAYDGAGNRTSYVVTTGSAQAGLGEMWTDGGGGGGGGGGACPALPPRIAGSLPNPSPKTKCDAAQPTQGITLPVTLQLTTDGSIGILKYSKNGGGQTTWTSGSTLSVVNNDTLSFCVTSPSNSSESSGTITVTNQTDFNTAIGSITYELIVGTPP